MLPKFPLTFIFQLLRFYGRFHHELGIAGDHQQRLLSKLHRFASLRRALRSFSHLQIICTYVLCTRARTVGSRGFATEAQKPEEAGGADCVDETEDPHLAWCCGCGDPIRMDTVNQNHSRYIVMKFTIENESVESRNRMADDHIRGSDAGIHERSVQLTCIVLGRPRQRARITPSKTGTIERADPGIATQFRLYGPPLPHRSGKFAIEYNGLSALSGAIQVNMVPANVYQASKPGKITGSACERTLVTNVPC